MRDKFRNATKGVTLGAFARPHDRLNLLYGGMNRAAACSYELAPSAKTWGPPFPPDPDRTASPLPDAGALGAAEIVAMLCVGLVASLIKYPSGAHFCWAVTSLPQICLKTDG